MTGRSSLVDRRRAQRAELLGRAHGYLARLSPALEVRAVVVFGSVARGDHNVWSDVDVLVIADRLGAHPLRRYDQLPPAPLKVSPVAWTRAEWRDQLRRRNPIAVEARSDGVWLAGGPDLPEAARPPPHHGSQ